MGRWGEEEGSWELGVGGWGEEKVGRLDNYQLSTQHSSPTRNSEHRYAEASYGTLHSLLPQQALH
uniref:Uncharacterized protein n=1 Tax=Desertifilum tharense IPPAS B-1220 TaxID=1781255 RepID=A0ACD5GRB8_9CYAN